MAMDFQLYTDGSSFLYRLDPRTKIIGVLFVFTISVLFTNPFFLGPFFFAIILIDLVGGVPLKKVAILLKSLSVLVIISLIMWPLMYEFGEVVVQWRFIRITDTGIVYGFGMAFRILNMVIAPISLMLTTRQRDLLLGLRGLGLPNNAAFALATAFRFVPTVVGVGNGIIEAQRSRGLDINQGSIVEKFRNYAALLGPLLINSFQMAQQLALAVESKGMSSPAVRTTLRPLKFDKLDYQVLVGYGVLLITSISLRVLGFGSIVI